MDPKEFQVACVFSGVCWSPCRQCLVAESIPERHELDEPRVVESAKGDL